MAKCRRTFVLYDSRLGTDGIRRPLLFQQRAIYFLASFKRSEIVYFLDWDSSFLDTSSVKPDCQFFRRHDHHVCDNVHLCSFDFLRLSNKDSQSCILSSRLSKISSVFVLVFQSLLMFGFGPYFRICLHRHSRTVYEFLALFFTAFLFVWMFIINHFIALIFLGIVAFITLAGPLLFIYAYRFKNDIRGPWDLPNVKQYHHLD